MLGDQGSARSSRHLYHPDLRIPIRTLIRMMIDDCVDHAIPESREESVMVDQGETGARGGEVGCGDGDGIGVKEGGDGDVGVFEREEVLGA